MDFWAIGRGSAEPGYCIKMANNVDASLSITLFRRITMGRAIAILFIVVAVFASAGRAQDRPTLPNHEELKAKMGWLIGRWEGQEADGSRVVFDCKWILDEQFVHVTVSTGTPLHEFLQAVFGWNPIDKKLTVAGFSVAGGQTAGECVRALDNEVHFAVKGVSPDGPISLILVYSHPAKDTFVAEYRDWRVGEQKRDAFKIEFKR